jgi:DNA repair exonuclease SbcCD nuclease subunit
MPIKVAIISDSHFDLNSRWEETLRVHEWFVSDIKEREANAVLHAGDFGPLVPIRQFKPVERLAVAHFAKRITDHCPFVGVRGNHDVFMDLAIFNELETRYPLKIMEIPEVYVVTANNGAQVAIAGMPWPVKAELLTRLDAVCGCERGQKRGECESCKNDGLSPEQKEQITSDLMRNIFLGLGAQLRALDMPSILLMHAMVRASRVSTGQPIAPGQDFEIGQDDLGLVGADFYALGHVHMSQEWTWNDATIAYCGSPRRTNYGERETKSYILLEIDTEILNISPGDQIKWQRIRIPCSPMLAYDCDYSPDQAHGFTYEGSTFFPDCAAEKGADFRFRYRVAADQRDAAKHAAAQVDKELREHGCADVKIEEIVIQTTRARVEEITTAQTIEQKLQVLWKSRDDVPPAERQERLFAKLGEIEREIQTECA